MAVTDENRSATKTVSILGCGWLGLPLGERLTREGYKVKGSTTRCERFDDIEAVGVRPYLVIVDPDMNCDDPGDFFTADALVIDIPPGRRRVEVESFHPRQIRTLVSCIDSGRIPFVIYVSSTSVYPDVNGVVREEDAGDPRTVPGRAILEAENVLRAAGNIETTIVRFGGLIGGDRNPARHFSGKKNVPDPDAPVNLIHRDDCVQILSLIIERDIRGEVFNACCDDHPTKKEFYSREAEKLGLPPPTFATEKGLGGRTVSSEKLKRILQYEFIHPDLSKVFPPAPLGTSAS